MGKIKDLMIGVMNFAEDLSEIYQKKIINYKIECTDLKVEKFLNEFNKDYEEGLIPIISDYIPKKVKRESRRSRRSIDMVVEKVMRHNKWSDIDF